MLPERRGSASRAAGCEGWREGGALIFLFSECVRFCFGPSVTRERERERERDERARSGKRKGKRSGLKDEFFFLASVAARTVHSFAFFPFSLLLPLGCMHPPLNRTGSLCAEVRACVCLAL